MSPKPSICSSQVTFQGELMRSLYHHLKPAPYPYGMLALRILGKMGGQNRSYLQSEHIYPSTSTMNALENPIPLTVKFDCNLKPEIPEESESSSYQ